MALVGVGPMPTPDDDEREEAQLLYVAATWATRWLLIGASGRDGFAAD